MDSNQRGADKCATQTPNRSFLVTQTDGYKLPKNLTQYSKILSPSNSFMLPSDNNFRGSVLGVYNLMFLT